jgi:hypothetical protein
VSYKQLSNSIIDLSMVILIAIMLTPSHTWAKGKWILERNKKGVVVSSRAEGEDILPSFKGVGRVKGNMYEILAILRDGKRRREWMTRSGVTRVLKRYDVFHAISYQQTLAPWPVSDREVVMETQVYLRSAPHEVIATFNAYSWKRSIRGIDRDDFVLMPKLQGYWRLVPLSPTETEVTYMVNTDPGGLLPNFLIRRITRDLPYYTILGLRKQIKRSRGRYTKFLSKYDPDQNATPEAVPPPPPSKVTRLLD